MRDLVSHISIAVLVQDTYIDFGLLNRGGVIHFFRTAHLEIQVSPVEATLR